jgi:hypothetical protein
LPCSSILAKKAKISIKTICSQLKPSAIGQDGDARNEATEQEMRGEYLLCAKYIWQFALVYFQNSSQSPHQEKFQV